jgi:hypothetical protein
MIRGITELGRELDREEAITSICNLLQCDRRDVDDIDMYNWGAEYHVSGDIRYRKITNKQIQRWSTRVDEVIA